MKPLILKTGKGECAEGDRFIGATVPEQRRIARQFRTLPLAEVDKLLHLWSRRAALLATFHYIK